MAVMVISKPSSALTTSGRPMVANLFDDEGDGIIVHVGTEGSVRLSPVEARIALRELLTAVDRLTRVEEMDRAERDRRREPIPLRQADR